MYVLHSLQITDLYAAVDSVSSFEVGSDSITVTRGDRFLDVDMSTMSSYGDTLLCKTQDFTESVSLQIVPGIIVHSLYCQCAYYVCVHYLCVYSVCSLCLREQSLSCGVMYTYTCVWHKQLILLHDSP